MTPNNNKLPKDASYWSGYALGIAFSLVVLGGAVKILTIWFT